MIKEYYKSMISMKELILATYVEITVEVEKDLRHGITSLTLISGVKIRG
jgi:hypothetical protein